VPINGLPNSGLLETVASLQSAPLLSSLAVQGSGGLDAAFRLLVPKHIKGDALADVRQRADPVDPFLHPSMATVPSLHCVRGRAQQLVVQERQRFLQIGRKQLPQDPLQFLEPTHTPTQAGQFRQARFQPTAAVEQSVDFFHNRPQGLHLRQSSTRVLENFLLGWAQSPLHKQETVLE
jgi:hypothetical protein